jgi:hypothetical protein
MQGDSERVRGSEGKEVYEDEEVKEGEGRVRG